MLIVFCVSGFWHGAGWNYIAWGMLHGCYQVIAYLCLPIKKWISARITMNGNHRIVYGMQIITTFFLVDFAWIFFRTESVQMALGIIWSIFRYPSLWIFTDGSLYGFGLSSNMIHVWLLSVTILLWVDVLHCRGISIRDKIAAQQIVVRWVIYYAAIFSVIIFGVYGIGYQASDFIYMQF
ncbi:MAG: hypothetical protein HFH34_09285 [Eubacterium sp.]|nr:hypothetical protein [Eubacterium sp.]